jgi:hypothetical protein
MTETTWAIPHHRLDASTALRAILAQHQKIRGLLLHAREVAERAIDQEVLPEDAVASAIGDIHATLEVHLSFEEKVLTDIFEDDPPLGPARAAQLRADHARQRATLASLHREARAVPHIPMLAVKLAFLATWLLDDMEAEERTLLSPDSVREGIVVVDQSDG